MADFPRTNDTTQSRIVPDAQVQLRFEKFAAFVEEYRPKISLGGMFLETGNPKPLGSTISCEFKLTDGFKLCRALGEVVWIRRGDGGPAAPSRIGIRFEAIDFSDIDIRVPRLGKARQLLGFEPRVEMDEAIRRTARWYEAHADAVAADLRMSPV